MINSSNSSSVSSSNDIQYPYIPQMEDTVYVE